MDDRDDDALARMGGVDNAAEAELESVVETRSRAQLIQAFKNVAKKQTKETDITFVSSYDHKTKFDNDSYAFLLNKHGDVKLCYTNHHGERSDIDDLRILRDLRNIIESDAPDINELGEAQYQINKRAFDQKINTETDRIKGVLKEYRANSQKLQEYHCEEHGKEVKFIYSSGKESYTFDLILQDNTPPSMRSVGPANESQAAAEARLLKLVEALEKFGDEHPDIYTAPYKISFKCDKDGDRTILEQICANKPGKFTVTNPGGKKPGENNGNDAGDGNDHDVDADQLRGFGSRGRGS
jgi:hypothetical protein